MVFLTYAGSRLNREGTLTLMLFFLMFVTACLLFSRLDLHILSSLSFQQRIICVRRLGTRLSCMFHLYINMYLSQLRFNENSL